MRPYFVYPQRKAFEAMALLSLREEGYNAWNIPLNARGLEYKAKNIEGKPPREITTFYNQHMAQSRRYGGLGWFATWLPKSSRYKLAKAITTELDNYYTKQPSSSLRKSSNNPLKQKAMEVKEDVKKQLKIVKKKGEKMKYMPFIVKPILSTIHLFLQPALFLLALSILFVPAVTAVFSFLPTVPVIVIAAITGYLSTVVMREFLFSGTLFTAASSLIPFLNDGVKYKQAFSVEELVLQSFHPARLLRAERVMSGEKLSLQSILEETVKYLVNPFRWAETFIDGVFYAAKSVLNLFPRPAKSLGMDEDVTNIDKVGRESNFVSKGIKMVFSWAHTLVSLPIKGLATLWDIPASLLVKAIGLAVSPFTYCFKQVKEIEIANNHLLSSDDDTDFFFTSNEKTNEAANPLKYIGDGFKSLFSPCLKGRNKKGDIDYSSTGGLELRATF